MTNEHAPPQRAIDRRTAATCPPTPEQMEGPYYLDRARMRADITEGKRGVPHRHRPQDHGRQAPSDVDHRARR